MNVGAAPPGAAPTRMTYAFHCREIGIPTMHVSWYGVWVTGDCGNQDDRNSDQLILLYCLCTRKQKAPAIPLPGLMFGNGKGIPFSIFLGLVGARPT